jgi:hypothetical protein
VRLTAFIAAIKIRLIVLIYRKKNIMKEYEKAIMRKMPSGIESRQIFFFILSCIKFYEVNVDSDRIEKLSRRYFILLKYLIR